MPKIDRITSVSSTSTVFAGRQVSVKLFHSFYIYIKLLKRNKTEQIPFLLSLCYPLAKTSCNVRFNPIANKNNHIKILKINEPSYLSLSFFLNYPEFPDSWIRDQFTFSKNIFNMLVKGNSIIFKRIDSITINQ
jgi:hypothetical protein